MLGLPWTSSVVNTPLPAETVAPLNENPNTTSLDVLTVNPASSAAPPDAPRIVTPLTLNLELEELHMIPHKRLEMTT